MHRCTRRAATQWRTGQTGVSCPARNGRSPGEESSGCTVAARGKRRSRPLPTKAIDEAVGERGSGNRTQGDLARFGWRVQCLADGTSPHEVTGWDCRATSRHPADRAWNGIAPARRVLWLLVTGLLVQAVGRRRRTRSALHSAPPRPDPPACSRAEIGIHTIRSGSCPAAIQNDKALKPRPALPDGALWRA